MPDSIASIVKVPVRLIRWKLADGTKCVAFRGQKHELLEEPTDFVEEIRDKHVKNCSSPTALESAVDAAVYALKEFHSYLSLIGCNLRSITDARIDGYKNWSFGKIRKKKNCRGELQAKQSVNVKLRQIYSYLAWCQKNERVPPLTVGWTNCNVQTSLLDVDRSGLDSDRLESHKYPKLYRRIGERSRKGRRQHWATPDEIIDLERWLTENENPYAARRDILMIRVADVIGWRLSTLLDLRVSDFSDAAVERAEKAKAERFVMVPWTQKNNANIANSIPWELVYEIRRYIQGNEGGQNEQSEYSRKALLIAAGASEKDARGRIFLRTDNGRPLTRAGTNSRMSSIFKAVGMPVWAGWHSLRRGNNKRAARKEIEFRRSFGGSMDHNDIAESLSKKLNQTTTSALNAYYEAKEDMQGQSVVDELEDKLAAAEARGDALQAQVNMLKLALSAK
ncbi:hypothetical protein EHZ19_16165 [Paraburkholderia bannensis]|nr:hypothetical protein [Paraburkholderia bannensis]RQM47186.1 hypothetical protein EHZ19_16165 [Paraburkholderia bannensis]